MYVGKIQGTNITTEKEDITPQIIQILKEIIRRFYEKNLNTNKSEYLNVDKFLEKLNSAKRKEKSEFFLHFSTY